MNGAAYRALEDFGEQVHRLLTTGQAAQAEAQVVQRMREHPDQPALWLLLGHALRMQHKYVAMAQVGDALMEANPNCPDVMFVFGYAAALYQVGRLPHAVQSYARALELLQTQAAHVGATLPKLTADLLYGMGLCHDTQGEFDKAKQCYDEALAQQSDHAQTLFAEAVLRLKTKGLVQDAALPAARFLLRGQAPREGFACPRWQGEALTGKRVVLYADQGVGDMMMFASLLPQVLAEAQQVAIEVQPSMASLFARSFLQAEIIVHKDAVATAQAREGCFDYYAPMSDLLRVLKVYRPAQHGAYLMPDADRAAELKARYRHALGEGRLVGISWRTISAETSFRRSIPLEIWGEVLREKGCRFVSLQYSGDEEEIAFVREKLGVEIWHDDLINTMRSHDDFCAQIAAMDAVVSVQNATVHAAGAMGVPCCLLLAATGDWRYGTGGNGQVWYDSVEIIRQRQFGRWQEELAQAAGWLRSLV